MTLIQAPVLATRDTSWELPHQLRLLRDVTSDDAGSVDRGHDGWQNHVAMLVRGYSLARIRLFMAANNSDATIGVYSWPDVGAAIEHFVGDVTSGVALPANELPLPIDGTVDVDSTTFYELDTIATPDFTLGEKAVAILPETQAAGRNAFLHVALLGNSYLHVALPSRSHRTLVAVELFA